MELTIAILFLVIGIILEIKFKLVLYHSMRERFWATFIVFGAMMAWELVNVYQYKAWLYPGPGMVGVYFLRLPIELWLFYLTSPYFAFVIYELIHHFADRNK